MKKKLLIVLGALGGLIAVCLILCFTLFSLKTVEVDFRTSTSVITGQAEEIIKSGEFGYGGSVIFMGKKNPAAKIEKSFPYIKVINIETVFPSKYIIHCSERQQVYAIELNDKTYICDEDFKVLEIKDGRYEDVESSAILFKGLRVKNANALAGEFLEIDNNVDLYSSFIKNNRLLHEQKAIIKSIETGLMKNDINKEEQYISLQTYSGQTFILKNAVDRLDFKVMHMLNVYSQIYSLIGKAIDREKPAEGDNVWTKEKLDTARVEIRSFYLQEGHEESDMRIDIYPQNMDN